jgi:hypothetical protein
VIRIGAFFEHVFTDSDINRDESVQRSFTKAINYQSFSAYKECLIDLCLDSLQCRRVNVKLLFCDKLLHGLDNMKSNDSFLFS